MKGEIHLSILMITASPQPKGAVQHLCQHFLNGVATTNQAVKQFDVGQAPLPPLTVNQDGNFIPPTTRTKQLMTAISEADTLVFATPVYLYGMTAQLKAVIDHMVTWPKSIGKDKTAILIADSPNENFDQIKSEFKAIFTHFDWTFGGQLLAAKVPDQPDADLRFYPQIAEELGKSM